jgi:hypothetical protein
MKINDLRDFNHPPPSLKLRRDNLAFAKVSAFSPYPSAFPIHPFPLQNVKEQAPKPLTYSTLTLFDGNAIIIIQLFSMP